MNRKVVVWSGGFDSTLVLLNECKNYRPDTELFAVSVSSKLVGETKMLREKRSRENLRKLITEKFPNVPVKYLTVTVDADYEGNSSFYGNNQGLAQPIIWAMSVIPIIPDDSELIFGYLATDQASVIEEYIVALIQSACCIQRGKKITPEFPIHSYTKLHVLREFLNEFPEFLLSCTCCENSFESTECGYCVPCSHLLAALISIYKSGSDKDREVINYILTKKFKIKIQLLDLIEGSEGNNEVDDIVVADLCKGD